MKIKNLFESLLVIIMICMFALGCSKKSSNNNEEENIENPTEEDATEENIEDAWLVEEYKDGYSIIGYKKSDINIVFPAIINNKKVYQILVKRDGSSSNTAIPIFPDGSKIVSLDLSKSVYLERIGENAFYKCTSLKSIVLPDNVTFIGDNVFMECSSLESIVIPNNVTYIGSHIFAGCTSLKSVVLSKNLNFTNNPSLSIFQGCSSLESIVIPEGNTSIQSLMFISCTALKSVSIASTVTEIRQHAFNSCRSLTHITIPNSVADIGNNSFLNSGIVEIYLPSKFNTTSEKARIGIPSTATVIPN